MQSRSLAVVSFGTALAVSVALPAAAQEHCKISWEVPAANATYTQQHVIDVGDVPGHQVRIFEIHRTYPDDKPNCEGLKRVESWNRGYSDYVDRNGRAFAYQVTVLENGDKIFAEVSTTSQTVVGADGSKKSTAASVVKYTGGTGKYQGVRGLVRESALFDPEKNMNQSQDEGEYWFEK